MDIALIAPIWGHNTEHPAVIPQSPSISGRTGPFFHTLRRYHQLSEHMLAMHDGQLQEVDRAASASEKGGPPITKAELTSRKLAILEQKASLVLTYYRLMTRWYPIYTQIWPDSLHVAHTAMPPIDTYIERHINITDHQLEQQQPPYPPDCCIPHDLGTMYDDSASTSGESVWCPVSGGYVHKSDMVIVTFLPYRIIDDNATWMLFGDRITGWHGRLSAANCMPMCRTYSNILNEDRAFVVPTDDMDADGSQGFYFCLLDKELRDDNAPDVYYGMHGRRLDFRTRFRPNTGYTLLRLLAAALHWYRMAWPVPLSEIDEDWTNDEKWLLLWTMKRLARHIETLRQRVFMKKNIIVLFCQIFGCMSVAEIGLLLSIRPPSALTTQQKDESKAIALQFAHAFNRLYAEVDKNMLSDIANGVLDENNDEENVDGGVPADEPADEETDEKETRKTEEDRGLDGEGGGGQDGKQDGGQDCEQAGEENGDEDGEKDNEEDGKNDEEEDDEANRKKLALLDECWRFGEDLFSDDENENDPGDGDNDNRRTVMRRRWWWWLWWW